jgi:maltose alpha-D-glucosyltransferase/alpha-amylase
MTSGTRMPSSIASLWALTWEVPEIGWGTFELIATRDVSVLAIRYEWRNNSALFVHNLASAPREISLIVYAYRWYRVGGLDYLLRRSDIEDESARKR